MALSVIGAGLGRTGTLSLKLALETLGFKRCCHMFELVEHYDRVPLWAKASRGEKVNWDEVFTGFDCTVDWPAATYYRELADHYPNAKVVLTVRNADQWFESTKATIAPVMYEMALQSSYPHSAMMLHILRSFGGNFESRQRCIDVYNKHNEEVKRTISPDRLLVIDISAGWQPLCEFLNVSIPDSPFPRINDRNQFPVVLDGHLKQLQTKLQSMTFEEK